MVMIQQFILGGLNYPNHHPPVFIFQTTQKDFSQTPPKTIHPHQHQIFLGEARNYFWQLGIGSASHTSTLPLI